MKFYLAPLEGVTGYIYRNAFHTYFGDVDKYFIPFISPTKDLTFTSREWNEIIPEHNQGMYVVPQILTNNTIHFIEISKQLEQMGHQEVNLNVGCPSRTVVTKGKGAGFLAHPDQLHEFLDTIFSSLNMKISVKTRIGVESSDEFMDIMKIYNEYPMEELIVHPRIQKDFYKNHPDLDVFREAVKESNLSICYNGDLFKKSDYDQFIQQFPMIDSVMLGRGIIANPGLIGEMKGKAVIDIATIRKFHDDVLHGYQSILSGDKNVLFKMKEFWFYLIHMFENHERYAKKLRKVQQFSDYMCIVDEIFGCLKIGEDVGFSV